MMGLALSHGKFQYSYSTFKDWRIYLAKIAGVKHRFNVPDNDILNILLEHSDCGGTIDWKLCAQLADRISELLPKIKESPFPPCFHEMAQEFINGLRLAYESKEDLIFY